MNILNEEICAIRHTIAYLQQGVVLEPDSSKKEQMRRDIKELDSLLKDKLKQCSDYQG